MGREFLLELSGYVTFDLGLSDTRISGRTVGTGEHFPTV